MTPLTVDEARAAYLATIETWIGAVKEFKRYRITQAELDAADQNVAEATARYRAALESSRVAA